MSNIAIHCEGLGKQYRLGAASQHRYKALRDVLAGAATAPFRAAAALARGERVRKEKPAPFWALRDVSFDIEHGEIVGVIGRNGAGKSTLLKILSRITTPTTGYARIHGRVGSLLEVGSGFHPELTGRDNIYMNGAILGMTRREIERKFDEIVAFAEVEKFVDTPVKRYSSGMYVRLAFAVAAHLEPEILIVDEVLAVGDAEFQKKCLGKMDEVSRHQALLLEAGRMRMSGSTADMIKTYVRESALIGPTAGRDRRRPSWAEPWIKAVKMVDRTGVAVVDFGLGDDIGIEVHFSSSGALRRPVLGIVVKHRTRGEVGGVNTRMTGYQLPAGKYSSG